MTDDSEEFMRRIQDQFDKIVDSVPHKSKMSESEKLRQQEIKNRKAEIKKELDFKCEKCGHEEKITVKGIQNFFV